MATYVEFLGILARACEQLRDAGVQDDEIRLFATGWLQQASAGELEELVGRLEVLRKEFSSGKEQATAAFADVMSTMELSGSIANRPEMLALPASETPTPLGSPKYPVVKVNLADLEDQLWPILRRVSYAMSDAGLDDGEIEKYKNEMTRSHDPVGVSRRWVHVS